MIRELLNGSNLWSDQEYISVLEAKVNELESRVNTLTTFIDNSEAGMYVTDYHTGEVLYANRKMADLGGYAYDLDMIIGKICWKMINPKGEGRCPFCPYKNLINSNNDLLEPYEWEHFFKEYGIWLKIISQAIIWTDGRIAQMNTFHNITEVKKMQEELAGHAGKKEYQRMQQNLQTVLDLLPVAVRILDLDSREVIYCNNAASDLFGMESPSQAIGLSADDFIPEFQPDGTRTIDRQKSLDKAIPSSAQFVCHKRSGEKLEIFTTACVIDYNGKQTSLGVMKNMADENRYQRMQHTLQEVLDILPMSVRITDLETTKIVYVNKACAKMFDYSTQEEMIGLSIKDLTPPYQSDGTDSMLRIDTLIELKEPFHTELEYMSSKGKIIDSHINVCIIDYEDKKCSLGIITDLSIEREQRRMLENAAEKEREANKLKSSFLSNMSHEIRTPMNAIIGLTEIELRKKHSIESSQIFKKINISAKILLQIVNDILDMSKIEADKLELFADEFELEEVIYNALLVASPRLEGKNVELMLDISLDLPRFVIGDKTRLWQVLKNYLDNAAKFTKEGYIALSIEEDTARSTEDMVYILFVVDDTGVGMNEEQMVKAFLPYEQVYNEAQIRYTGTGLGLPLSKRICELMGGSMKIESCLLQGTTICFTIPFKRSKKRGLNKYNSGASSFIGLKVLAVDDSDLSLDVIGTLLKKCGIDYCTANNGDEALQSVKKCPDYDIIFLDYIMKDENGFEAAKKIRGHIKDTTKILLVTAYGSCVKREEMEMHGIDDMIEKPFTPSQLLDKILTLTGKQPGNIEGAVGSPIRFKGVRILVCEDNEINQEVVAGMLEQLGIVPVFAENGKIGIHILKKEKTFDLILMDIHMPVMDGYAAARAIRSDSKYDDIPIICLTADAMTEVVEQCLSNGMNDYLSKPFEMDSFHNVLLKWLPDGKQCEEIF